VIPMAGANNRQLKAAGFKAAAIKVIRSTGGRGLSLRSAISSAQGHGLAVPAKAVQRAGTEGAPEGWKRAARGEKPAQPAAASEANAKARQEARAVYEKGNAASGGKLAEMRSNIRQLTGRAREADERLRTAKNTAESAARKALGEPKKGPKAKQNRAEHERKLAEAVRSNPDVQRAAAERAAVRAQLSSTLASRNDTAKARKQQRGAESGGQMDLFSGAPAPRQPSPFERRIALRDARAAQVGRAIAPVGRSMLAQRQAVALQAKKAAQAKAAADFRAKSAASMNQIAAKRAADAERAARRAFVKANPRQRGEADYVRSIQKAAAAANHAIAMSALRPGKESDARVSTQANRLNRLIEIARKNGVSTASVPTANPYLKNATAARTSVAVREQRQKAADRRKRDQAAAEAAYRRSIDFLYR